MQSQTLWVSVQKLVEAQSINPFFPLVYKQIKTSHFPKSPSDPSFSCASLDCQSQAQPSAPATPGTLCSPFIPYWSVRYQRDGKMMRNCGRRRWSIVEATILGLHLLCISRNRTMMVPHTESFRQLQRSFFQDQREHYSYNTGFGFFNQTDLFRSEHRMLLRHNRVYLAVLGRDRSKFPQIWGSIREPKKTCVPNNATFSLLSLL